MKLSRIVMLFTLIFFIGFGAGMGIYISQTNYFNNKSQNTKLNGESVEISTKNPEALETGSNKGLNSIGPNTKIIKKEIYTKGQPFEKLIEEKVSEEIVGMNKEMFVNHIKQKGYTVEEFSGEKVVMSEKINKWPIGLYVLKSVEDNIVLYKIDEKGELKEHSTTGVMLEQVSENDQEELQKGKVYNTLEEAENTLGDYDS